MGLIRKMFGIKKKKDESMMENWFQVEYGKNWWYAYNHYLSTGSIHYKG